MARHRVKAQPIPKSWVNVRSYRLPHTEKDDIYSVPEKRRAYLRKFCTFVETEPTKDRTFAWCDTWQCSIPDGKTEQQLRGILASLGLRGVDIPFSGKVGIVGTGSGEDTRGRKGKSIARSRVREAIAHESIPHDLLLRLFPWTDGQLPPCPPALQECWCDVPAVLRMLHSVPVPRCSETGLARCPNSWTDEPKDWHKLCKRWDAFAACWHLIHGSLVAGQGNNSWQAPYNELCRFIRSALDGQGGTHCETVVRFGQSRVVSVEHVLPDSRLIDKRISFDKPSKASPVAHGCNGKADLLIDPDSLPSMGGTVIIERS